MFIYFRRIYGFDLGSAMTWDIWSRYKEVIAKANSLEALTKRESYYQPRRMGLTHKVENGRLVCHRYNANPCVITITTHHEV